MQANLSTIRIVLLRFLKHNYLYWRAVELLQRHRHVKIVAQKRTLGLGNLIRANGAKITQISNDRVEQADQLVEFGKIGFWLHDSLSGAVGQGKVSQERTAGER